MYQKIVVPMALDHGVGNRALEIARNLRSADGEIIAFHALEPIPRSIRQYISAQQSMKAEDETKAILDERIATTKNAQTAVVTGRAGWSITDFAHKIGADCIVISSHKPGLQHLLLGSTASHVVSHARCAVHVIR